MLSGYDILLRYDEVRPRRMDRLVAQRRHAAYDVPGLRFPGSRQVRTDYRKAAESQRVRNCQTNPDAAIGMALRASLTRAWVHLIPSPTLFTPDQSAVPQRRARPHHGG